MSGHKGVQMRTLTLELDALRQDESALAEVPRYDLREMRERKWVWDRVVKSTHPINCAYQMHCNFNIYVKDGVVLREEQAANYPAQNDPDVPDFNPRGCQKGACHSQHMYDPTRIKYPLKRAGARGEGRWQRLTWDAALAEVADAVIDACVTDGPETIIQGGGTRVMGLTSEGTSADALFMGLGAPISNITADNGDEHQGAAYTFGKIMIGDSADNWLYADMILVWGGNPAYTNIPNFHFIAEARYRGTKVVAITPDYNPSAMHTDLWVPLNIGSDAALALSMCQVILREKLYNEDFIREQTDLPLLVVESTGRFLREQDLKRGGRTDVFYFWDQAADQLAEAPRKSLALNGSLPSLDGTFQVETLQGRLSVKPVFALLREQVDREYTPEQASAITGVPPAVVRQLAREIAAAGGVVNISTYNWGKFYHGDLIERALILLHAVCGHIGRKGATYSAFVGLSLDTTVGGQGMRGDQILLSAAGADPRFAGWREDGFTDEMILYEYVHDAFAQGGIMPTSLMYYVHAGLLEQSEQHNSWDPYLKRPLGEYVREAFEKRWQFLTPGPDKEPRVMFAWGGNFLRRVRSTDTVLQHLLPKLRLLVTIDWRWNSTALYSDIVLPVASWYERNATTLMGMPVAPFVHVTTRAVEPLYESRSEWELFVLLARKIEERARQRGISSYTDEKGVERRFAGLEAKVTFGGLYSEDDEEGLARDSYLNAHNVERMDWKDLKEQGIARYDGIGTSVRSIGNACDIIPGEPVVPLTWHTEKKQPYPTLTRRIQFYIDQPLFLELGEALPVHKDSPKAGGDYPLQITGGHARWSIHSDFITDSLILQLQRGEPAMLMSAEDARARSILDGDTVEVFNDVGSFRIQAMVSPAVRAGQVVIYHAWENHQFANWQHFKTVMPSPLNPVELAGDYFHIRPITLCNYPGFSDRQTRVEVRSAAAPAGTR
jgi:DMSO reductase family type II enzyme molybdopterin subunit